VRRRLNEAGAALLPMSRSVEGCQMVCHTVVFDDSGPENGRSNGDSGFRAQANGVPTSLETCTVEE
jgi:hypothetical protein